MLPFRVKGENIQKLNTTNPLGALQSQSPGVNIVANSGQPGKSFDINIRGAGTNGSTTPLYIIDGVEGDINSLSPADIESLDVLKMPLPLRSTVHVRPTVLY